MLWLCSSSTLTSYFFSLYYAVGHITGNSFCFLLLKKENGQIVFFGYISATFEDIGEQMAAASVKE